MGDSSYYPSGSNQVSENRLFTGLHNDKWRSGLQSSHPCPMLWLQRRHKQPHPPSACSAVSHLCYVMVCWHGTCQSIDDFFQESGRAGRSGAQAKFVIYWKPSDAPLKRVLTNPRDAEVAAVQRYLENRTTCRRYQLLHYFDPELARSLPRRDCSLCCDVCAATLPPELIAG